MYYQLTDHFIVAADQSATWEFFSRAENLPRITPPWLRFTNLTNEPIQIALDSTLDYTIRWAGVPIRWQTRIIDWTPPTQFIDLQIRGPYTLWHHQHRFTPTAEGTECTDRVIYKLPGSLLGRAVHATLVRRQLQEIFRYRRQIIGQELGWVRAVQPDIAITVLNRIDLDLACLLDFHHVG
jgi:ligand-binding SRPBCC domain-containing protein